jgi:hypothetical protein
LQDAALVGSLASTCPGIDVPGANQPDPLDAAIDLERADLCAILLRRPVTLNRVCGSGWTYLISAAAKDEAPIVRMLLARGADPAMRGTDGETAVGLARLHRCASVMAVLRRWRGRTSPTSRSPKALPNLQPASG